MKKYRLLFLGVISLLLTLTPFLTLGGANSGDTDSSQRWHFFSEEAQIGEELLDLARIHRPESIALRNVRLLDVRSGTIHQRTTVIVSGGRIVAVGPDQSMPAPKGARVIDGHESVVLPGLVDMHVHTLVSYSQPLLELAEGVTTVRDMDGFPWLLSLRKRIREDTVLGPNEYVTGQILNFYPLDWYARVVKTPQEARAAVDEQARAGYDFIKVHNSMPMCIYRAIAEESHKDGLDFVGHIPHEVLVAQAVEAGQRTLEHMKGFYLDDTLKPSTEDWAAVMRDAKGVYVCPTFYVTRNSFRGEEAKRLLEAPEIRYVPWQTRALWQALAEEPVNENQKLERNVLPMSIEMSQTLHKIGTPFLTGTDSGGGYPFHVPGFALHEEFRYFTQAGFSPLEIIRSATMNAALAMRKETEFGTVERGMRADLLLVGGDPLSDLNNVDRIEGVMVRGIWLDRETLDDILEGLARLYAKPARPPDAPNTKERHELVGRYRDLRAKGLPLRDQDLAELCRLLEDAGERTLSDEVSSWRGETPGP